MSRTSRVLVVGTTPDYVDHIVTACPGRALFLTDKAVRRGSVCAPPPSGDEIICSLEDTATAGSLVAEHLFRHDLDLSGVACFDCESMELAAVLANRFGAPYPSRESVGLCRDKLRCKEQWRRDRVHCPSVRAVRDLIDVRRFLEECRGPVVLKPVCGSGSELTFLCDGAEAAEMAFWTLKDGLAARQSTRMYEPARNGQTAIIAEQYVSGLEYSCDAIVDKGRCSLIRVARKHLAAGPWLGTCRAYELPAMPHGMSSVELEGAVLKAAESVGLRRAMCMVDFIACDDDLFFIEIAPRPGGGCLPPLIRKSCGLDMLTAHLDFAEGRRIHVPHTELWEHLVGLRILADRSGSLESVETQPLSADPRVLEVSVSANPGRRVQLPPDDYDSWVLGHVVFRCDSEDVGDRCDELAAGVSSRWAREKEHGIDHDRLLRRVR